MNKGGMGSRNWNKKNTSSTAAMKEIFFEKWTIRTPNSISKGEKIKCHKDLPARHVSKRERKKKESFV